jgi:catechol 2,3-dioxygenase-like lactoylglutathione lyase family enzyme
VLAQAFPIGFIPIRDFATAERFYAGLLGLPVVSRDPFALVLRAAGGVMIRCTPVPEPRPQPFTIFGWEVEDIAAAATALIAAGVSATIYPHFDQDSQGIWTAPGGDRVLWFQDPFGNILSLSQHTSNIQPTAVD